MRLIKRGVRFIFDHLLLRGANVNPIERFLLRFVALLSKPFVLDGNKRMRYLEYLQDRGISVLPARYFEPVPLIKDVRSRTESVTLVIDDWADTAVDERISRLIEEGSNVQACKQRFMDIRDNRMFGGLDLMACEHVVTHFRPKRVVEIGAGYSTYVFVHSTDKDTKITSIEPFPTQFLRDLAAANRDQIELVEARIQDFGDNIPFASLEAGDVLFVDSTHVCNIGGDLPDIFARILPRLRPGVLVHFHDVALPYEYPASLVYRSGRLYNEQYLLAPLIAHGAYVPLFGSYRFLIKRGLWLNETVDRFINRGASLWMTKA